MKVHSFDGVPIHYEVTGEGEPALIFVHGFCCDGSYWKAQVPFFSRYYQVVTIDLAGHGESGTGRKSWTSAAFGADVTAVIKDLNLHKVILIAHSMGGGVIAETACQIPERVIGLIGVDSFLDIEQPNWSREKADAYLEGLDSDPKATMYEHIIGMFVENSDPELMRHIVEDMSASPLEVTKGMVRDRSSCDRLIAEAFKEIKVPIYSIVSDMITVDVETAKRYAASFDITYMKNVGHFIMMEDPETFNRLLLETIQKLTGRTPD